MRNAMRETAKLGKKYTCNDSLVKPGPTCICEESLELGDRFFASNHIF